MALKELDTISKTPGMGIDILLHPELLPKNKSNNFWIENLVILHKVAVKSHNNLNKHLL